MLTAEERLALIRVKIQRAKKHLGDLEVARDGFVQSKPYIIDRKPNTKPGHEGFDLYFMTQIDPVPDEISTIFGDAIHNLRSALDHLAFQLVEVGGGKVSDQTSFPIFKSTEINEPSFAGKVNGMSDPAKDKIRSAEPYKDGKGHDLWVLHKLDIADKHHKSFATLMRVGGITIHLPGRFAMGGSGNTHVDIPMPRFAAPGFGEALEVNKPFFTCERGAEKNTELVFDIAISEPDVSEPKPIVWAVSYLIDKVDRLICEFEPLLD
jgi:hypothetical protein